MIDPELRMSDGGQITYANEVIAIISGIAANEIEGIAGMVTSGGFGDIIGKNRNITRGVKVEVGTEEVSVDLYTLVEYGQPIQRVATQVQENVRKSIEAMTGLKVVRVDVHIQGVSFEKEKQEVQSNLEAANVPHLPEISKKRGKQKKEEHEQVKTDSKTDTNISDEELLQQPDAENSLDKVSDVITDEDRSNTNTEA
ncbi:MAG: Asp23/Gls24 family envelope stress response protein [Clostridiales bacterium]|nr:Asp23/Gls24 family envelope stress response protein [Clostridiales bacterium]